MIRRPPRSTLSSSSAASDVYKRSPDGSAQLLDANEVARGVAERAVAHAPGLRRRLLEHLGARCTDLLEGGVEVVGAEDRRLQRALSHERQEGVALSLRTAAVRLGPVSYTHLTLP